MTSPANETQHGGTHYRSQYQHWDFVCDLDLNYLEGCATKYVARWRNKNGLEDLQKAAHYVQKLREKVAESKTPREVPPELVMARVERVEAFEQANDLGDMEAGVIELIARRAFANDLEKAQHRIQVLIEYAEGTEPGRGYVCQD